MALGVLSYASQVRLVSPWIPSPAQQLLSVPVQIILAQADRDQAVDDLLKKLGDVYGFMAQDKTLDPIESMHNIVSQILNLLRLYRGETGEKRCIGNECYD